MAEVNKIQFKRGNESSRSGVTPADGEPIWVSDEKKLYVGDGSTAGGIAVGGSSGGSGDTFTAYEAISAGDPVSIRSDGDIEVTGIKNASVGTTQVLHYNNLDSGAIARLVMIDTNKALAFFEDPANNNWLGNEVITFSGDTMTEASWGLIRSVSNYESIRIRKIATGKVAMIMSNYASSEASLYVQSVSGTTKTLSSVTSYANSSGVFGLTEVSTDKFITVVLNTSTDILTAYLYTVSGTTITQQDSLELKTSIGSWYAADMGVIEDGKFLLVFNDTGASSTVKYMILSESGNSLTKEYEGSFTLAFTVYYSSSWSLHKLKDGKFLFETQENATINGKIALLYVNGTTVTPRSETSISTSGSHFHVCVLSETKAVALHDENNDTNGVVIEINADEITLQSDVVLDASLPLYNYTPTATSTADQIAYVGHGSTDVIGRTWNTGASNIDNFIGFSAEAITATNSGVVNTTGVNTSQTGLTFDADYYVQQDGTLSTSSANAILAGKALSATEILVSSRVCDTSEIHSSDTADTAPSNPSAGDQWFDSVNGLNYTYYTDGDGDGQWLQDTPLFQTTYEQKLTSCVGYDRDATGSAINCSTTIPWDDTIPQITEGTEVASITYTPKYANSTLLIRSNIVASNGTAGAVGQLALFIDGASDAVASAKHYDSGSYHANIGVEYAHTVTSTSSITIAARAGASTGSLYANSNGSGSRRLGGVGNTFLEVMEITTSRYASGETIQTVFTQTQVSTNTNAATDAVLATKVFTPKSTDSTIIIECCSGSISAPQGAQAGYGLMQDSFDVETYPHLGLIYSSSGTIQTGVSFTVSVPNSSLSSTTFEYYTVFASATKPIYQVGCIHSMKITEIQN